MAEIETYRVDFLLVHVGAWDAAAFLAEALRDAVGDAYDDVEDDADAVDWAGAVSVRYTHTRDAATLVGVTLAFDGAEASAREAVSDVARALRAETERAVSPLVHALKFQDPLLQLDLARRARELFVLEMRLREALSVVLLGTYEGESLNLLREIAPNAGKDFERAGASAQLENELFYLTFTDYKKLNERAGKRDEHLEACILGAGSFEELQLLMGRSPIHDDTYQDFVASLNQLLDAVERVRNCVAHNRTVPNRTDASYPAARNQMAAALDTFLAALSQPDGDDVPAATPHTPASPASELPDAGEAEAPRRRPREVVAHLGKRIAAKFRVLLRD